MINFRLPSTNKKSLMINIDAAEQKEIIKLLLSLVTYLSHSVVFAQSSVTVMSLLTFSDCDDSFLYYLSISENLSQDKMTF